MKFPYEQLSLQELKTMPYSRLEELADSIRTFLIESIARTGGHLSSNLGIVEITLALHAVFNSPEDKIIFDVGHQSYVHKILTGRADQFDTLRQSHGLSGFQKRKESPHDPWEAGHSSTSLSAALGMAAARDLKKEDYEIIPIIGDGALTGGMAMEALNDLGAQNRKVIIIFNDNNMSISKNIGGMEQVITRLRTSEVYRHTKKELHTSLPNSSLGKEFLQFLHNSKNVVKQRVIDNPLFTQFNLDYIGPVDGHNIEQLIEVLNTAKEHEGPIVVHVRTCKGKGYLPAEKDQDGSWHGVGPFNIQTGKPVRQLPRREISWSEVMSNSLIELAKKDPLITAITPAMANGSKLLKFQELYPDRFFDAGIAEQHAMTMAAGMAQGGLKPFISVYSSFLQRAYDQVSHDVARMNLPVVIGIDRAGLVGEDGSTHQGIYDISFLRSIPNLILSQPKDAKEAQNLLFTAFKSGKPFAIRYPRGTTSYKKTEPEEIEIGTWTKKAIGTPKQIVIAYGPDVDHIAIRAAENNMNLLIVNARFFKPVDTKMLQELVEMNLPITVYETDTTVGGLGEAILDEINRLEKKIDVIGIEDRFVPHGSIRSLRKLEGISTDALFEKLEEHEEKHETGSIPV